MSLVFVPFATSKSKVKLFAKQKSKTKPNNDLWKTDIAELGLAYNILNVYN